MATMTNGGSKSKCSMDGVHPHQAKMVSKTVMHWFALV